MALYLSESDIDGLLTPGDAVDAIEACFERMARGEIENRPRYRLALTGGKLAVMAAADLGLGVAGCKTYAAFADGARSVLTLFAADRPEVLAVIEADMLGRLRTGAASGVAAKYLARAGTTSLGIIGCGRQAEGQAACIRAAVPAIEDVVAYCRTEASLAAFCEKVGAEPGESAREMKKEGGKVISAVGANNGTSRELDNHVLERASFVCCDSIEDARLESADLIEPVRSGSLDWLEVHELHEVVAGDVPGRAGDDDIVIFKSNGLAAWDVALGALAVERSR